MANFCPNCGVQNEEGAAFCINCGARLDAQPDTRPAQPVLRPDYEAEVLNQYYQTHPQKKSRPWLTIGIIIGVILLIFVLLGIFVIFIMPGMIVDKNYQRPTETYAEGYTPHADYDTLDLSTLDYGDEDIMKEFSYTDGWTTLSSSAQRITDYDSVLGFWKAVMITDPDNESDEGTSYDYFNIEIYGMDEDAGVIINWDRRVIEKTGEVSEFRGSRAGLSGTFKNGSLTVENSNIIEITDFWSDGDKEYAVGTFTWTNGSTGYLGLVRDKK